MEGLIDQQLQCRKNCSSYSFSVRVYTVTPYTDNQPEDGPLILHVNIHYSMISGFFSSRPQELVCSFPSPIHLNLGPLHLHHHRQGHWQDTCHAQGGCVCETEMGWECWGGGADSELGSNLAPCEMGWECWGKGGQTLELGSNLAPCEFRMYVCVLRGFRDVAGYILIAVCVCVCVCVYVCVCVHVCVCVDTCIYSERGYHCAITRCKPCSRTSADVRVHCTALNRVLPRKKK